MGLASVDTPRALLSWFGSPMADAAEARRLVDRAMREYAARRHGHAASLFARAEKAAAGLHDDASLVPVYLRLRRAESLGLLCLCDDVADSRKALLRAEARELVINSVPFVQRRLAAGTLAPGTNRADEASFFRFR